MNDGVKLLLERIKTHPEEFVHNQAGLFGANSRWHMLVQSYDNYLDPEDRNALHKAMNEVMAEKFTEAVMKELMGAEDDDPLGKSQKAHSNTVLGGLTQGQSMSPYQQAQLSQAQTQMRQMQLAQQAQSALISSSLGATGLSSGTVTMSTAGRVMWANEDTKKPWKRLKDWLGV